MTHAIRKTSGGAKSQHPRRANLRKARADECHVVLVHIIGDIFLSPLSPVFQVSKILNRISSVAPALMLLKRWMNEA
ncbi:uncharacterized protein PHALS_10825 [Plasmopara halstedii]|uniref:Uncharacterized protein n=1 Tax=Plasmopara halstedii TaxID=4781 RepID=A0A0P1AHN5_PLAHL|nr:uncharacterized protein PHALS_10825 [Plasmopara halstedii]CEG40639.1 hypothetical protein PHALS_10825 [Plasmopara halstedii]|eukprot:XP_024577008.1 hypothetical protein PHALS_10825 [Plasmopara halstedii]